MNDASTTSHRLGHETRRAALRIATTVLMLGAVHLVLTAPANADVVKQNSGSTSISRSAAGLPPDWVARGSGCFYTADPTDHLCYFIHKGVASPDVVEFRLEGRAACLGAKRMVLPDGEGNQWKIDIKPASGIFSGQSSLWAHQVRNGQYLVLWKSLGVFNLMRKVLEIGDLAALAGGDRVTVEWQRDSASCHT